MGRKVKVLVCRIEEVEVPDEVYQAAQYSQDFTREQWVNWENAIYDIGRKVGFDTTPEEGGDWFVQEDLGYGEPWEGIIAMLNEDNEIMAQA